MNVLITQHRLNQRGGTELYVLEHAKQLIQLGHRVVVFCPQIGKLKRLFDAATISVVTSLRDVMFDPDIIHGHHGIETLIAMLQYPSTPAVYVLHDWAWVQDKPPNLDRIAKYVAVDETCLDRLTIREGIPSDRTMILQNAVDLEIFLPRADLPQNPKRALIFSNYVEEVQTMPIQSACHSLGIQVDIAGARSGALAERPEKLLLSYDVVFAKGRCAREALAVGCAVIVSDVQGAGKMVTTENLEAMARLNFGRRLLTTTQSVDSIRVELSKYNWKNAGQVSQVIRKQYGQDQLSQSLIQLYQSIIDSNQLNARVTDPNEYQQIANYLTNWTIEMAAENFAHPPTANQKTEVS